MTHPHDPLPSIARRERLTRVALYALLVLGALLALLPMLFLASAITAGEQTSGKRMIIMSPSIA